MKEEILFRYKDTDIIPIRISHNAANIDSSTPKTKTMTHVSDYILMSHVDVLLLLERPPAAQDGDIGTKA